jgi:hypothetical protein
MARLPSESNIAIRSVCPVIEPVERFEDLADMLFRDADG